MSKFVVISLFRYFVICQEFGLYYSITPEWAVSFYVLLKFEAVGFLPIFTMNNNRQVFFVFLNRSGQQQRKEMYFYKKTFIYLSLCLGIFCCGLQGCERVVPFRGPTGHPKFEGMDWYEIDIKYWIVKDTTNFSKWDEDEKSLKLRGKELDILKNAFKTSSSNGTTQGSIRPWVLSTNKGNWYFELASPNTAFFCKLTNTEQAYYVELSSTVFYEKLKSICLENEKLSLPSIQFDNIRMCRRFGGTQGPQEKIVAVVQPVSSDLQSVDSDMDSGEITVVEQAEE